MDTSDFSKILPQGHCLKCGKQVLLGNFCSDCQKTIRQELPSGFGMRTGAGTGLIIEPGSGKTFKEVR